MPDYIDRNHAIAALSILEIKNPNADFRDARRAIADVPEPSRKDKLRYALEVIHDECESCTESCWDCLLFVAAEIGSCCELDRDIPKNWKPERMIHNYDAK